MSSWVPTSHVSVGTCGDESPKAVKLLLKRSLRAQEQSDKQTVFLLNLLQENRLEIEARDSLMKESSKLVTKLQLKVEFLQQKLSERDSLLLSPQKQNDGAEGGMPLPNKAIQFNRALNDAGDENSFQKASDGNTWRSVSECSELQSGWNTAACQASSSPIQQEHPDTPDNIHRTRSRVHLVSEPASLLSSTLASVNTPAPSLSCREHLQAPPTPPGRSFSPTGAVLRQPPPQKTAATSAPPDSSPDLPGSPPSRSPRRTEPQTPSPSHPTLLPTPFGTPQPHLLQEQLQEQQQLLEQQLDSLNLQIQTLQEQLQNERAARQKAESVAKAASSQLAATSAQLANATSSLATCRQDLAILSRKYDHVMAAKLEAEEQRDGLLDPRLDLNALRAALPAVDAALAAAEVRKADADSALAACRTEAEDAARRQQAQRRKWVRRLEALRAILDERETRVAVLEGLLGVVAGVTEGEGAAAAAGGICPVEGFVAGIIGREGGALGRKSAGAAGNPVELFDEHIEDVSAGGLSIGGLSGGSYGSSGGGSGSSMWSGGSEVGGGGMGRSSGGGVGEEAAGEREGRQAGQEDAGGIVYGQRG